MSSEFPPLQPGDPQQIGTYRLLARLGAGGMGRVYLGRSPDGRTVAVKVIHPILAEDQQFRRRFGREVTAARRVGGEYTAQVVDADPDADPPWLVTEYVAGPTLQDAVDQCGPLPAMSVAALGAGLAEGLRAIHVHSVIHRDLKPGNVLLAADRPRIIDFGIARAMDATSVTTRTGLIGTPGYMSPEQYRGEPISTASDVFCLAAVLTFAATGRRPFGDGPDHVIGYRVVMEDPDLTGVPASLLPLIEAGLAKNPDDRPTVQELLDRCSALAGNAGMPLPPAVRSMINDRAQATEVLVGAPKPGGTPPANTSSSSSGSGVAAAVVGVIILLIAAIWYGNAHDSHDSANSGTSPAASVSATPSLGDSYTPDPETTTSEPDTPTPAPATPTADPTADAFAAISVGDCLDAYEDPYTSDWSKDLPEAVDCDRMDGYIRVTSIGDSPSDCGDDLGQSYWDYTDGEGNSTYLCVDREIHVGDCILGTQNGSHVSLNTAGLMATWDCDSDKVPRGFNYILRITNYWDTGSDSCPAGSFTWDNVFGVGYLCAENAYHG